MNKSAEFVRSVRHQAFIMLLVSLFFFGCSGSMRRIEPREPSPENAQYLLEESFSILQRLEANTRIHLNAGAMSGAMLGEVYMEIPGNFCGIINGPFGWELGKLIIADSLFELQMGRGEIVTGDIDTLDLQALFGLPLPNLTPQSMFMPIAVPPTYGSVTTDFEVNSDSNWVWQFESESGIRCITIDPAKGAALSEQWYDEQGNLEIEKVYEYFSWSRQVAVPSVIRISVMGIIPIEVVVQLESYEVNPRWEESPFRFLTQMSL